MQQYCRKHFLMPSAILSFAINLPMLQMLLHSVLKSAKSLSCKVKLLVVYSKYNSIWKSLRVTFSETKIKKKLARSQENPSLVVYQMRGLLLKASTGLGGEYAHGYIQHYNVSVIHEDKPKKKHNVL